MWLLGNDPPECGGFALERRGGGGICHDTEEVFSPERTGSVIGVDVQTLARRARATTNFLKSAQEAFAAHDVGRSPSVSRILDKK